LPRLFLLQRGPRAPDEAVRLPRERPASAHALGALLFAALVFAAGLVVGRHTAPRPQPAVAAPAGAAPGSAVAGKSVFASAGCAACHALAAAGAKGNVGPNLDDAKPDAERVSDVVTNGKGAMPPYRDRLTDTQIRDVAAYVAQAARA